MAEIYLHHFDASPFAEKVRIALGIKQLSWRSVQIPMVMPKPDLTVLTGGYRKTPVLQIGADVYCDTQLIAGVLERVGQGPALFPDASEALCHNMASFADTFLFRPGAGLSLGTNLDLPEDILADRFAFFDFLDRKTLPGQLEDLFAQFRAGLQRLEDMLTDGRAFLLGEQPGWADAACYAPVWMSRGNIRGADSCWKNYLGCKPGNSASAILGMANGVSVQLNRHWQRRLKVSLMTRLSWQRTGCLGWSLELL